MDELDALEALVGIGDAQEIACPGGEIVASAPEDAELAGLVALAVRPPSRFMPRDPHDRGRFLTHGRLEVHAKHKAEVQKMKAERLAQQLSIVKLCKSSDISAVCSASDSAEQLQPLVKGAVLCALEFSRKNKMDFVMTRRQDLAHGAWFQRHFSCRISVSGGSSHRPHEFSARQLRLPWLVRQRCSH